MSLLARLWRRIIEFVKGLFGDLFRRKTPAAMHIALQGEDNMTLTANPKVGDKIKAVASETDASGNPVAIAISELAWNVDVAGIVDLAPQTDGSAILTAVAAGTAVLKVSDFTPGNVLSTTITIVVDPLPPVATAIHIDLTPIA